MTQFHGPVRLVLEVELRNWSPRRILETRHIGIEGEREAGCTSQPFKRVDDQRRRILLFRNNFRCSTSLYRQLVYTVKKRCIVRTGCSVLHNFSAYKVGLRFKMNTLYIQMEHCCCNQMITAVYCTGTGLCVLEAGRLQSPGPAKS